MCEVCEFMVKSVGEQLKDNSEEAVIGTFERVCNLMPELEQKFVSMTWRTYGAYWMIIFEIFLFVLSINV